MGRLLVRVRNGDAASLPPKRIPLPTCIHLGDLLDVTACRCKVYHCKLHGTCSDNKRAGLRVCRECPDNTPIAHTSKS